MVITRAATAGHTSSTPVLWLRSGLTSPRAGSAPAATCAATDGGPSHDPSCAAKTAPNRQPAITARLRREGASPGRTAAATPHTRPATALSTTSQPSWEAVSPGSAAPSTEPPCSSTTGPVGATSHHTTPTTAPSSTGPTTGTSGRSARSRGVTRGSWAPAGP